MRSVHLRVVTALIALAMVGVASAPAGASGSVAKHYVAAGGGPTVMDTALAPCSNTDVTPSAGGACFTVTGPVVVHVSVKDVLSGDVAAYWNTDFSGGDFFCNEIDVIVPDSGIHKVGVWVGGVDTTSVPCGTGQATTGWIFLTPIG